MHHLTRSLTGGAEAVYVWFEAMHTRVDILLKSSSHTPGQLLEIAAGMQALIVELEHVGNRFDPSSEISVLNALPAGEELQLSERLHDILSSCVCYHASTGGLFDITALSPGHTPNTIRSIHISDDGAFTRDDEDVMLDLSGFLKGYALDCLRPLVAGIGLDGCLISLGNSSIMAIGDVPGPVKDGCLTTSGNDSDQRCHIRNPLTGEYVRGAGRAQVITAGGAEGEVLATCRFITDNQM